MGPEVETVFSAVDISPLPESHGTIEKATTWPLRNGLQGRRLARSIALVLSCRLLNVRHFAEGEAWVGVSTIEHHWFTNGARNATTSALSLQKGPASKNAIDTRPSVPFAEAFMRNVSDVVNQPNVED
jgi:hypothetical protein